MASVPVPPTIHDDDNLSRPTRQDLVDRVTGHSTAADGLFACLQCSERFLTLDDVNSHSKIVHARAVISANTASDYVRRKGRTAVCPDCQSHFDNMQNLQKHFLRRHTDERPFKCKKCEKAFKVCDRA